jgi:hypothetical protein
LLTRRRFGLDWLVMQVGRVVEAFEVQRPLIFLNTPDHSHQHQTTTQTCAPAHMPAPRRRPSHRIQSGPPPQWRAALSAQPALERVFVFFCGAGAGSVICYCLLISVAPPHCNCQRQQPPPPAPAAPRAALAVGRDLRRTFGPKLGRCTSVLERLRRKVWYFRGVVLVNMATLLAMRRSRRCLLARTTKQPPKNPARTSCGAAIPGTATATRAGGSGVAYSSSPSAAASCRSAADHRRRRRRRRRPRHRRSSILLCVCAGGEGCERAAQRAARGE